MISFKKIDPEIIKTVSLLENKDETLDCVVYVNSYFKSKEKFIDKYKNVYEYPFINAFGIKLKKDDILSIANYSLVTYIAKQTTVFAQIDVAKKIMELDAFYDREVYGKNITVAVIFALPGPTAVT